MNKQELIKEFKEIGYEEFFNKFEDLLIGGDCFGEGDGAVCVNIIKADDGVLYIASGFEWEDITDNTNEVEEWFENSINWDADEEEIEKIKKEKENLIEFLSKF